MWYLWRKSSRANQWVGDLQPHYASQPSGTRLPTKHSWTNMQSIKANCLLRYGFFQPIALCIIFYLNDIMSGLLISSHSSSGFAQQGSVDWVALSNTSVQFQLPFYPDSRELVSMHSRCKSEGLSVTTSLLSRMYKSAYQKRLAPGYDHPA